jgi:hypothetical protein
VNLPVHGLEDLAKEVEDTGEEGRVDVFLRLEHGHKLGQPLSQPLDTVHPDQKNTTILHVCLQLYKHHKKIAI